MINQARLIAEAAGLGVTVSNKQAALLDDYCARLAEANKQFNLTAITDPREMEVKHLLDCLVLCRMPELTGPAADIGTGAGFPGAVLKIMKPELDITLIDATAKKLAFVADTCAGLGLEIKTLHGRAEELARGGRRECFQTATARAVAPLAALAEVCLPLVRVGGILLAMKGPEAEAEISEAQVAIARMGGVLTIVENFELPGGLRRAIVKIKKISQTPAKYPRNGSNIAKRPLKKR